MVSFRIHSSQHLEMKALYKVPTNRTYKSELNFYFFTPSQLNINGDCIDLTKLGMKLTNHARYSSPSFTLTELLDLNNKISPLTILRDFLRSKKGVSESSIIHETQNLANAYKHESKETLTTIGNYLYAKDVDKEKVIELAKSWYSDTIKFLKLFRKMLKTVSEDYTEDNLIRTAFFWCDEYISLIAEKDGLDMYFLLEPHYSDYNSQMSEIMKVVRTESSHRDEMNYETGEKTSKNNSEQEFAYRKGQLKKWAQSVLYLIPKQSHAPQTINFTLATVAAAIAMAFAIFTATFATTNFKENTIGWALFIILAYAFKDRIKEGLKALINILLPKTLADRIFNYRSPRSERMLCRNRQKINIESSSKIDIKIRNIRKDDNNPFRKMMPPEDVVHFTNYYRFYKFKKSAEKQTPWVEQLAIITRLRMDDWLKEMDDTPSEAFGTEEENVNSTCSQRIYHIHLVVSDYRQLEKTTDYYHYLIVAQRDRILKIEEIPINK